MQFNSLSGYAERLNVITLVVFRFQTIQIIGHHCLSEGTASVFVQSSANSVSRAYHPRSPLLHHAVRRGKLP